jgi:hypothetical protein
MGLIHGRSPKGETVTNTNPVMIGGENAAGNASTLTVEGGAALVSVSGNVASEYEALTIDSTAGGVALTAAKYGTCTKAFITVETAQIRFTVDGTAPTTTAGHILNAGDNLDIDSNEDIAAFRAIRTGSTSGVIQCTYSQ